MSFKPPFDPDQLIVKAEYFLRVDHDETVFARIKDLFSQNMMQDGYRQVDPDINPFRPGSRSMRFQLEITKPETPLFYRVKKKLNLTSSSAEVRIQTDQYMEALGRKRPDIPFEIEFHFQAITLQNDTEGYEVELVARPILLQLQHSFFPRTKRMTSRARLALRSTT